MANSAFNHSPSIVVPGSSTNTALIRWSGTGADTFLDSTIIVGATTMGLAADTNLLTFADGTLTIGGTLSATLIAGAAVKDEDNMASNSATHLASQQSIKAYADTKSPIDGATLTGTTQFATLSDGTIAVTAWADEDNMASNSATLIPTQQSVKAYVDAAGGSGAALTGSTNNTITTVTGADAIQGEAGLTYSGTAMLVALAGSPPAPDHVSMHIWEGDAGSVAASTDTQLIIEHSGNAGITILTPNSGTAQLSFGCPAENRQGSIFYDQSANMMTLRSGNDNLKRITLSGSSGDATIYSNLVIGTSGKGIDFSATANSSGTMANELLDDYEEGTWTPLVQDHNLDARSQTYGNRYGRYQKVGNIVHISGKITMTSLGSLTTTSGTRIAGFPFTSSSTTNNEQGIVATYSEGLAMTANGSVTGKIYTNTTYAYMYEWDATIGTGGDGLTLAELSADGLIEFFGSYVI